MKTIFLSGSRAINRLNKKIRERLTGITSQSFQVLIGDANGADKALQEFLNENHYSRVKVYCSGGHCRNNVGAWETHTVQIPSRARGRDFYTQKDRQMAKSADHGFVLWDGKSPGSIENVIALLRDGKSALVYYTPDKEFVPVGSLPQLKRLLTRPSIDALNKIEKKIKLERQMNELEPNTQKQISFELPQFMSEEDRIG